MSVGFPWFIWAPPFGPMSTVKWKPPYNRAKALAVAARAVVGVRPDREAFSHNVRALHHYHAAGSRTRAAGTRPNCLNGSLHNGQATSRSSHRFSMLS
jgi:hypothetical protein